MISKKKIIAIVAFILMGFVMFTFANPSDGIDPLTTPLDEEKPQVGPVNNEEPIDEQPVVVVDNAPVITVVPATIKVVEGTKYDIMTGVTVVDDRDNNLVIRSSIAPTEIAETGNYEVTYTVVDSANNTATAKRTIVILATDEDEDNDNYTNIEEVNNDSNFDDEKSTPVDEAPQVILTPEEITIEFGKKLDLIEGLEVKDDFDSIENGKLLIELDIEDTTTLTVGKHTINYTVTDRKGNVTLASRKIIVEDTTAPTIRLNGEKEITLEAGIDTYEELNATATDIVDGTWTVERSFIHYSIDGNFQGKVSEIDNTKVGTYKVQYSCKDKAGNPCMDERGLQEFVIRTVIVEDTTAPTIRLNGEKEITLEAGIDTYEELNATATDIVDGTWTVERSFIHYSIDGNFQGKVSEIDNTKLGTYKVQYSCKDKAGNECVDATKSIHKYALRIVNVVDRIAPVITGIENGATYEVDPTFGTSETIKTYIIDGVEYTEETVNKTLTGEGNHTVKVIDLSGNVSDEITITIDYSFIITQKLSDELIEAGYRIAGGSQSPVVNKYFDTFRLSAFACVNDGTNYGCVPVVWKDSKGNTVSTIKDAKSVVSSIDVYYEKDETFTAYAMGSIIEYRLSDEFIELGYLMGSKNSYSNIETWTTVRTYYYNEETKLTTFPYVNSGKGTYEVYNSENELISRIDVDGITKPIKYNHVVKGHEVYTVKPMTYNISFNDYNGKTISSKNVLFNTDATKFAPNMEGKTYTAKGVTYIFTGWDKEFTNINETTVVTAQYNNITKIVSGVFELDENITRPENGKAAPNWQKVYTKLGEVELKKVEDVIAFTKKGASKVLNYNVNEVLNYVANTTALPVANEDMKENFKKYEWYVVKIESNDGWHIDGQKVVDLSLLTTYRDNAKNIIMNYATTLGFSEEIGKLLSTADIDSLTTRTTIDNAVAAAKATVDELLEKVRNDARVAVANENNGFKNGYEVNANVIAELANENITGATTKIEVETARDDAITELNNLKALMGKTFVVSLTSDENHVLISGIASDITINNIKYLYTISRNNHDSKFTTTTDGIVSTEDLDEGFDGDANSVDIEYTKNGKNYIAKYSVGYNWGWKNYIYMKYPTSIVMTSNSYVA